MSTLETSLMQIAAKAWSMTATVHMFIHDNDIASTLSDQFKAIEQLADNELAILRGDK